MFGNVTHDDDIVFLLCVKYASMCYVHVCVLNINVCCSRLKWVRSNVGSHGKIEKLEELVSVSVKDLSSFY